MTKEEQLIEYQKKRIDMLFYRLDKARRALCEVSRLSLYDNVDASKFYDIVHPVILELNKGDDEK